MKQKVPRLQKIFQKYNQSILQIVLTIFSLGLFCSIALQNIAFYFLLFLFLIDTIFNKKKLALNSINYSFLVLFFIYFSAIFYTTNTTIFFYEIKNKLPFLFFGIFFNNKIIGNNILQKVQKYFIAFAFISTFFSLFYFFYDVQYYIQLYSKGQTIPTILHHTKYSILLIFALVFCIGFLQKNVPTKNKFLIYFLIFYFCLFIQILATKTGIILLLFSLLLFVFFSLKKNIKYLLFLIPFLFFLLKIPTVKNKINYIQYDLSLYKKEMKSNNYSDSRRLESLEIGYKIFTEHKFFGVGFCNVNNLCKQEFIKKYNYYNAKIMSNIHNQYLFILCANGIIGLLIFILIFANFFIYFKQSNYLFLILFLNLLLVFFWEALLERQIGIYMLLFLFLLTHKKEKIV